MNNWLENQYLKNNKNQKCIPKLHSTLMKSNLANSKICSRFALFTDAIKPIILPIKHIYIYIYIYNFVVTLLFSIYMGSKFGLSSVSNDANSCDLAICMRMPWYACVAFPRCQQ